MEMLNHLEAMIVWPTMVEAWMSSLMRMVPLLANTVAKRKRKPPGAMTALAQPLQLTPISQLNRETHF